MKNYWFTITFILFNIAFCLKARAELSQLPFIFEYNLKGPAIIESEPVKTSGTIKAITCSWDFEGKTTIEVSANKGLSYRKIINGQILNQGFIPGNELCFKATVAENSILKKIVLGYSDSSGIIKMPVNPQLVDFKYHKTIRVAGGSEELFNYPLILRVDKEKVLDGICFVAADGATELEYYLEGAGHFWVKVPQIPRDGVTFYLYYGSKGAVNKSNPEKVFALFDDFSRQGGIPQDAGNVAGLNEEKWQKNLGLKNECKTKSGYLELRDAAILTRNFKMKEGILEFKAKADENAAIQGVIEQPREKSNLGFAFKEVFYSSAYPGAEHTIAINDVAKLNIGKPIQAGRDYIYKVIINSSGVVFERYSPDYEKQVQLKFLDAGFSGAGSIGLKTDASFLGDGKVYFDWVRARPYVEVEPRVTGMTE